MGEDWAEMGRCVGSLWWEGCSGFGVDATEEEVLEERIYFNQFSKQSLIVDNQPSAHATNGGYNMSDITKKRTSIPKTRVRRRNLA